MTRVVYTFEKREFPSKLPSIFLAGPTPRSSDVASWRPNAIATLNALNWDGFVYCPEYRNGCMDSYRNQVEWEHYGLDHCDAILMWVPRDLKDMPAMTTNIEFGLYLKSDKLYYGRPDNAPKNDYMDYCYKKFTERKPKNKLEDLAKEVIDSRFMK